MGKGAIGKGWDDWEEEEWCGGGGTSFSSSTAFLLSM